MTAMSVAPTLHLFWQHVRRCRVPAFVLFVALVCASVVDVIIPLYSKKLFDGLDSTLTGDALTNLLTGTLFVIVGLELVRWALYRVAMRTNNWFQNRVMVDLQETAFAYVLQHSYRFFSNAFAGGLVRKVHRFARAFETLADQFEWRLISMTINVIGMLVLFAMRSWLIAGMLAGWVTVFVAANWLFARWRLRYDEQAAAIDSEASSVLADAFTNALTIKQFTGFTFETHHFREVMERYRKLHVYSWNLGDTSDAIQAILMIGINAVTMIVAIHLFADGRLTIGDFALIQMAFFSLFTRLWDFGRVIRHIYEGFADAKDMVEILEAPHEIVDAHEAKVLQVEKGDISFDDVTFAYGEQRTILEQFTLAIAGGEKIAFVGPSGAGKSTVIKLLLRFFDVTKGAIRIDGQNIAHVTQDSLREQVSLVPQDPILFHRSLMENIRYGRRDATDAEVIEASKQAHCHEFIGQLANGYDTMVGERGVKLSGGERQRVAIARAMLKNAPVLVLDEATSSLDSESESLIQDALRKLMQHKTVIVIAHRLSTIMEMDCIVVIERGRVSDVGTHRELIKKDGTYKKLWSIQAGGFLP